MTNKKIFEKTWVNGGQFVYGDNPFREALYALEDELVCLKNEDGKFIPQGRMSKVMNAYEKFLKENHKESLSRQKEEFKRVVEKAIKENEIEGYHQVLVDILKAIEKL